MDGVGNPLGEVKSRKGFWFKVPVELRGEIGGAGERHKLPMPQNLKQPQTETHTPRRNSVKSQIGQESTLNSMFP